MQTDHEMRPSSCLRPVWYDMIWYDMIWYDMIWFDIRWDEMRWDDMIWLWWFDMIWYDMIWYEMRWDEMIWPGQAETVTMWPWPVENSHWWPTKRGASLFLSWFRSFRALSTKARPTTWPNEQLVRQTWCTEGMCFANDGEGPPNNDPPR